MAKIDGEPPFEQSALTPEIEPTFDSLDEARDAFLFTDSIRQYMMIQTEADRVPDQWLHAIQAFPESKERNSILLVSKIRALMNTVAESVSISTQAWSGGLVMACLLVFLVYPSAEKNTPELLGQGISGSEMFEQSGTVQSVSGSSQNIGDDTIDGTGHEYENIAGPQNLTKPGAFTTTIPEESESCDPPRLEESNTEKTGSAFDTNCEISE